VTVWNTVHVLLVLGFAVFWIALYRAAWRVSREPDSSLYMLHWATALFVVGWYVIGCALR
jgi:hypothetical protein